MCLSRIVAFIKVKNIDMIILLHVYPNSFFTFRNLEKKLMQNVKKSAWAFAWAGMNAGMCMRVFLQGPNSFLKIIYLCKILATYFYYNGI